MGLIVDRRALIIHWKVWSLADKVMRLAETARRLIGMALRLDDYIALRLGLIGPVAILCHPFSEPPHSISEQFQPISSPSQLDATSLGPSQSGPGPSQRVS